MKPVSKTAYYCCGVRMMDAESNNPIVNDTHAKTLMGEEGHQYWETYKQYKNPNGASLARCYLIDTWIKKQLKANPKTTIILIGAGLDSRAFRLTGGNWIELDEPGVIEYKNSKLPVAGSQNPVQRISIDFEKEKLADKLSTIDQSNTILIVIEGVLMYLSREQKTELMKTITTLFKKHILLCDLMNAKFFNKVGRKGIHIELAKSGASFDDIMDDPARFIINYGYSLENFESNVRVASDLGIIVIPKLVVKFLFRKLFSGYSSYQFRFGF